MNLKIGDRVRIKSSIEIGQSYDNITMLPSMKKLADHKTQGVVKFIETRDRPFVYAMRIYLKDGHRPMADLILTKNGKPDLDNIITIHYDDIASREKFVINPYTLIYDERINKPWYKL